MEQDPSGTLRAVAKMGYGLVQTHRAIHELGTGSAEGNSRNA